MTDYILDRSRGSPALMKFLVKQFAGTLVSDFRTLKQRGHDPITTISGAIATYLKTGPLPPLPQDIASNG